MKQVLTVAAFGLAVLAIVAGWMFSTNKLVAELHHSENVTVPAAAPDPEAQKAQAARQAALHEAQLKLVQAQTDEAKARADAQRAYVQSLAKPAPVEVVVKAAPVPAYSIPGKPRPGAKVYGNPEPDTGKPHVIVDFAPGSAIDHEAAVASGRCVAFSFVKAGAKGRTNRLWCDKVVAR